MVTTKKSVKERLQARGISRRDFLKFCSTIAVALSLPINYASSIAATLGKTKKPVVLWLEFQGCTGCTESFTRALTIHLLLRLFWIPYLWITMKL